MGLIALVVLSALTGCRATSASIMTGGSAAGAAPAAAAFRAGDFGRAEQLATAASPQTESSRLIRGMALQQLGRDDDASQTLTPLTSSRDKQIRGKALATLGLMHQARDDHARAAPMLGEASDLLVGTDQVWAAHYSAVSHRALGNNRLADEFVRQAGPAAVTSATTATGGRYTIQFGSFSTEARAARHRQAVTIMARNEGLPTPTIEAVQRGSRTLFAVRTGRFPTIHDASVAASGLRTETTVIGLN